MVKTRNGFTICDSRSDVQGQRWDEKKEPVLEFWDKKTFGLTDIILCTEDSSAWIADINGYWKEL